MQHYIKQRLYEPLRILNEYIVVGRDPPPYGVRSIN